MSHTDSRDDQTIAQAVIESLDARSPCFLEAVEARLQALRYTGQVTIHWSGGHPRKIDFPARPVSIHLTTPTKSAASA